jgi:hypothetical protein
LDRITRFLERIQSLRTSVVTWGVEPWRSESLAVLLSLQLALEAFLAQRTAAANAHLGAAEKKTTAQHARVRREILPTPPPDASEEAILGRKAELVRLLDLGPPGDALIDRVVDLAREAILNGDVLTLFCLVSGPLDLYYRARQAEVVRVRTRVLRLSDDHTHDHLLEWLFGPDGIAPLLLDVSETLRQTPAAEGRSALGPRPPTPVEETSTAELPPE